MGCRYPIAFSRNFDQNNYKSATKFHCLKNSQRQSCSAINYLSNGINILQRMALFPLKLGLKAPTPNRKDAHFAFRTRRAVQSVLFTCVSRHSGHVIGILLIRYDIIFNCCLISSYRTAYIDLTDFNAVAPCLVTRGKSLSNKHL